MSSAGLIEQRMAKLVRSMAANPEMFPTWNAEAAEIAALLPDAEIIEARECAALYCDAEGKTEMARKYREGRRDDTPAIKAALIVLRRVREGKTA